MKRLPLKQQKRRELLNGSSKTSVAPDSTFMLGILAFMFGSNYRNYGLRK